MIKEEIDKRKTSFLITALILAVWFGSFFIVKNYFVGDDGTISKNVVIFVILVSVFAFMLSEPFLLKALYHWSLAKGYPGYYCLYGFFGPIGLIILAGLEDISSVNNQ